MAVLITGTRFRVLDASGNPVNNAKIHTYAAGTTTPKATYTTQAGNVENANPVRTNSSGVATIWLGTGAYRFVITDEDDAALPDGDVDNISSGASSAELSSTSDLAQGDALIGVKQPVTNAVARTQHQKNADFITVEDWGAVGDGSTDDTTALATAEAVAYSLGRELVLSYGKNYAVNGNFTCRVGIIGNGAKITNTAVGESLSAGVLDYSNATGVKVRDLTIDCNSTRRGLLFQDSADILVSGVKVIDSLFGGIAAYDSTDVTVIGCTVDGAIYPTPSTGHAADGFYFGSCEGVTVAYCIAKNFERIGFVAEGEVSGVKSDRVLYIGCHAEDAKNCDDSASEFNAAFWHENTNSVSYFGCTGKNISSGTGQTNGRVRGFVSAVGSDRRCKVNYVACGIYDNTADIPIGFYAQGTSNYPSVNYEGCYVVGCKSGLYILGGVDVLTLEQFDVDDITAGSGEGGVVLDISTYAANEVHIDGLRVSNKTYHADAADINWFSSHASTVYTLNNAYGVSHIMRQAVARATVTSSAVEFGSGTYAGFSAATLNFGAGAVLTPRSGAVEKRLFQDFQMTGGTVLFNGSTLSSGSTFEMTYGGASVNIVANGATFSGLTINFNMTGSFTHQFTGCRILAVPSSDGFYRSNSATATKHVLIMTGCYFEASNAANTPLRKNTNNPTNTVLHANVYNTTNLYTFDGGVTQANNLSV